MHRTAIFVLIIVAVHEMISQGVSSETGLSESTITFVDYEKLPTFHGERHPRSLRPCCSSSNHPVRSLKPTKGVIDVYQRSPMSDPYNDIAEKSSANYSNERKGQLLTRPKKRILTDRRLRSKKSTGNDITGRLIKSNSSDEGAIPRDVLKLSSDGERVDFQVHGHEGPRTYVFGFDTGNGKNRQYRLEERHRDGTVRGQYGYYDATGKLRMVKYIALPSGGYRERHHERREAED